MAQIIGRIYKITSRQTDDVYIGSTTLQLSERFKTHMMHYRQYVRGNPYYTTSYEVLQYDDARIELIHEGLFDGRKDLERFEGHTIKTTPNCVNKTVAGRTKREYYEDNEDKFKVYKQQWYNDNSDRIKERKNTKIKCEICGHEYTWNNRARHAKSKRHLDCLESSSDED